MVTGIAFKRVTLTRTNWNWISRDGWRSKIKIKPLIKLKQTQSRISWQMSWQFQQWPSGDISAKPTLKLFESVRLTPKFKNWKYFNAICSQQSGLTSEGGIEFEAASLNNVTLNTGCADRHASLMPAVAPLVATP